MSEKLTGLALMRAPFTGDDISKLPKPMKWQTDAPNNEKSDCKICGQWHHPKVIHLDYVGHAAMTKRLLECDPGWNWEPLAFTEQGLPMIDQNGGMWIRLTVCGQSRLGYGDAEGKRGGNAVKEIIGDALRNAAMRFGAALDLWHKGDLHGDDEPVEPKQPEQSPVDAAIERIEHCNSSQALQEYFISLFRSDKRTAEDARVVTAKDKRKGELTQ